MGAENKGYPSHQTEFKTTDEQREYENKAETFGAVISQIESLKKIVKTQNFSSVHREDAAQKLLDALYALVKDELEIHEDSNYKGRNSGITLRMAEARRIIDYDSENIRNKKE